MKLKQYMSVLSMGTLSLAVLVIQNAVLVLLTRYSRFSREQSDTYHTSTLVLNQEILKMVLCIAVFFGEGLSPSSQSQQDHHHQHHHYTARGQGSSRRPSVAAVWNDLRNAVFQKEVWKLVIPAALFTLQNFLIVVALSHLDAMTFQVLSQTKLLSAAVFSVWLLDRRLNYWQWCSLFILTVGVYLAQAEGKKENFTEGSSRRSHPMLGAVTCIISGLSSSFAGVYFEKVVKTTAPSLAVRNIHLSLFGIPFALLSLLLVDVLPLAVGAVGWSGGHGEAAAAKGSASFDYWRGYDALTWCLVLVHALGGLLVAVVVKYADNILKGFATGVAIIVSGVFTSIFWGYTPSTRFILGGILVTGATMLYHSKDTTQIKSLKEDDDNEGGGCGGGGDGEDDDDGDNGDGVSVVTVGTHQRPRPTGRSNII